MKKALVYSICLCLFSWGAFTLVYFLKDQHITRSFAAVYMFFPMITALAMQLKNREKPLETGFVKFNISWNWLIAVAVPFSVLALSILISGIMPDAIFHYGPEQIISMSGLNAEHADVVKAQFSAIPAPVMILLTLVNGLLAGCTINALFAFGEEFGWRNYMVYALRGQLFWKAAFVIGLVWGIWHMPLIIMGHNYPQHPVAGIGMMCVFCILMGIPELYIVLKTKSVIPAAMMHGTTNAIAGSTLFLIQGGSDLTIGMTGVSGFIAIMIVTAVICIYDIKHDRIMMKPILQK